MKKPVSELSHDEIAEVGANWLRKNGYPVAFANMTGAMHTEKPDALGFNGYGRSFLLEIKVSRADYLRDKKKLHREKEIPSIGHSRGYLTPEGLVKVEEIPYGWWLLEVYGKNAPRIRVVKGRAREKDSSGFWGSEATVPVLRNCDAEEINFWVNNSLVREDEHACWLLTILKRIKNCGVDIAEFSQHVDPSGGGR